jgi:hypothetical protein
MPHCDQSPVRTERRWAVRPLSRRTTISVLLLTWGTSWLLSMLSFYHVYGPWELDKKVPIVTCFSNWVLYPVMVCPIALPVSTNRAITAMFGWLPVSVTWPLALVTSVAFWPVYITFLVLALRTGKRRYLAVPGAMVLFASTYWHIECMTWVSV